MANEGEGSGVATIEGDSAIFKPEGAEEECQITLKFTGSKLVVTQTGICGFGHNVSVFCSTLHRPVTGSLRLSAVTTQFSALPSALRTRCSSFGLPKTMVVFRQ